MNKFGHGDEVQRCRLPKCVDVALSRFNDNMVLAWCVLSGCDYLPSIDKLAIKGAHSIVLKCAAHANGTIDTLVCATAIPFTLRG